APFDVIDSLTTPNTTAEQVEILRQQNGLDQPFLVQYFIWLKNILSGNLGNYLSSHHGIAGDLAEKIPNTLSLVLPAYVTALLLAVALGLL
ncbi:ABC transporter permease, partial [Streptococcus pyogenes]